MNLCYGPSIGPRLHLPDALPSPRWRLLVTPPAPGAENMALDEALMDRARRTGEWMLRVYSWSGADDFARPQPDRPGSVRSRSDPRPRARCRASADGRTRDSAPSGDHLQRHRADRVSGRSRRVLPPHQRLLLDGAAVARGQRVCRDAGNARHRPRNEPVLRRARRRASSSSTDASWPGARSGGSTARCSSTVRFWSRTINRRSPSWPSAVRPRSRRPRP